MFDCVLPTRNGYNPVPFTCTGPIRLKNAKHSRDRELIEVGCDCVACGGPGVEGFAVGGLGKSLDALAQAPKPLSPQAPCFSRSYLRHLFQAGEMLGGILVSLHNLRHFQRLLLDIRGAIRDNAWSALAQRWPVAFAEGERLDTN